jgi:hypothetical protein
VILSLFAILGAKTFLFVVYVAESVHPSILLDPSFLNMTKPTCLGTRMVVLSSKYDSTSSSSSGGGNPSNEGLLIVFRDDEKDLNTTTLQVSICNGRTTYTGKVDTDQVKLSPEDRQQLATYLLQDGSKHATIEITFLYSQHDANDANDANDHDSRRLELNIKQCLASGLKKFAYSTVCLKTTKQDSVLQCLHTLGDSLNASMEKNDRHQQEMRKVQQRLDDWKDTALKLDKDVWQHEKDQLLQNFLTLFNDAQTNAKQELDLLKRQTSQHRGGGGGTTAAPRAVVPLLDAPDDLDEPNKEPIPLDQVAALAQGKQTTTTRRKTILDPSEILSSSDLQQKSKKYKEQKQQKQQQAGRKSKATKAAAPTKTPLTSNSNDATQEHKPRPTRRTIPVPSFRGSLDDDGDRPPASKKCKQENQEPVVELEEDSEEEAMRHAIRENIRKDKATVSNKGEGTDSSKTKVKQQDDHQPAKLKLEQDEAMRRREELWKKLGAMDDDDSSTDDD